MANPHYIKNIGSMEEDKMWGVFMDWSDLELLFRSPHTWAAGQNLPKLAEGIITIIVTYQLDIRDQPPPLAKVRLDGHDAVLPIFVMSGQFASVVQVRILEMPQSGYFPSDFTLWMPPNGAILHTEGCSQPLPGGSVIEFLDGSTITIPEAQPLQFTLEPPAAVGYFHFPMLASQAAHFFSSAARDPQGYIVALREHIRQGMTKIKAGSDIDENAPAPTLLLEDIIDARDMENTRKLERLRMIYQTGDESPCSDICGKGSGLLSPAAPGETQYTLRIDTVLAYAYA